MQALLLRCGDARRAAGCMEGGEDLSRGGAMLCCYTQPMKSSISGDRARVQTWLSS